MQWQGLKIPIIILTLLAGIAFFFGMQWLYQKYSFQEPLSAFLSGNSAVESFQVSNEGRLLKVSLTISHDADLSQSYKEISKELAHIMGRKQFHLELNDSRDDVLRQVWYSSQYAVYQAAFQGSFQDMAGVVNREARACDAEANIYVDQDNIYVRLKHQGNTLDNVIPLNNSYISAKVQAPSGGGYSAQRN